MEQSAVELRKECEMLTAEIGRMRGAIDEALLTRGQQPDPTEATEPHAFLKARQLVFYESLKAQLGGQLKPSVRDVTSAAAPTLTWRGQKEKLLKQPRMSFANVTGDGVTFGPAPPVGPSKTGASPRPSPRRVRPSSAHSSSTGRVVSRGPNAFDRRTNVFITSVQTGSTLVRAPAS